MELVEPQAGAELTQSKPAGRSIPSSSSLAAQHCLWSCLACPSDITADPSWGKGQERKLRASKLLLLSAAKPFWRENGSPNLNSVQIQPISVRFDFKLIFQNVWPIEKKNSNKVKISYGRNTGEITLQKRGWNSSFQKILIASRWNKQIKHCSSWVKGHCTVNVFSVNH